MIGVDWTWDNFKFPPENRGSYVHGIISNFHQKIDRVLLIGYVCLFGIILYPHAFSIQILHHLVLLKLNQNLNLIVLINGPNETAIDISRKDLHSLLRWSNHMYQPTCTRCFLQNHYMSNEHGNSTCIILPALLLENVQLVQRDHKSANFQVSVQHRYDHNTHPATKIRADCTDWASVQIISKVQATVCFILFSRDWM